MGRYKAMRDHQVRVISDLIRDCASMTDRVFVAHWHSDTSCSIFIDGGKYKEAEIQVLFKGCHYEISDRVGRLFDPDLYLDQIEDYFIRSILHG